MRRLIGCAVAMVATLAGSGVSAGALGLNSGTEEKEDSGSYTLGGDMLQTSQGASGWGASDQGSGFGMDATGFEGQSSIWLDSGSAIPMSGGVGVPAPR